MRDDAVYFLAIISVLFAVVSMLFMLASVWGAEPPKDDLTSCKADLAVTAQYAAQQQRTRNQAEQDLARALARVAQLEAEVAKKK
jgi:hypothetical protein